MAVTYLLQNQTEDVTGQPVPYFGQQKTFSLTGTADGATAKVQYTPDDTTWLDIDDLVFTETGGQPVVLALNPGKLRAVVEDAGASTDLTLLMN